MILQEIFEIGHVIAKVYYETKKHVSCTYIYSFNVEYQLHKNNLETIFLLQFPTHLWKYSNKHNIL